MTTPCPSALARSAYVDGELPAADAAALESHVDGCAACRARIAALRNERRLLRDALSADLDAVPIPAMRRPFGLRDLAAGFGAALVVGALASAGWSAVDLSLPAALRWLNPLGAGALLDSFLDLVVFLTREGSSMLNSITEAAASAVLVGLLAWGSITLLNTRGRGGAALLSVLLLVLALPSLGHAFEVRRSDAFTTLPAGETVADTLLAAGETVAIDGNVTGDLFAFGRRVTIRGEVSGDVISAAETIDIEGTVRGNVFAAARNVTLTGATVRGNLYSAGSEVTVAADSEVNGNTIAAANGVTVAGSVGVDLMGFARDVTVRGNVQRNVTAAGAAVTVLAPARVGGNVTAYVEDPAAVRVTPGTVIGNVDTQVREQFGAPERPRNKYFTVGFYVGQVVRLGAAFVTGLILLWLFPGLQTVTLASGAAALRSAGIGLIAAVTMPTAALIAAVTVIGIPIALIVAVLWLLGLYFAKTVIAQLIGRELFKGRNGATPHYAATLLAGLVIVLIAVNMPWVGWFVSLVLTLVGLGMLVAYVADRSGRRLA